MTGTKPVRPRTADTARTGDRPHPEALLSTVAELSLESVMITDTAGRIAYVNPAFERISGYSSAEALGQKPSILKSGQHPPEFYEAMWQSLEQHRPWRGEIVNRRKDGTLYHAELSVTPVVEKGKVIHFLATQRDITEEVERRRAEGELEQFRTDMVGIVSHDLRSPLANVISFVELVLEDEKQLSERHAHLLHRARDNAKFMIELIADILDTTRIDSGKLKLVASRDDIRSVIEDALERNAFIAADKGIRLEKQLPPEALAVTLDRSKIVQVLNNLISNAVKFSAPGKTVRVGAKRSGRSMEVWVADEGPGIAAEEVPHLFDKFYRASTRSTRGEKSTGLGLYIVSQMLKLHHATIRVDTAPGKGSTFTFTLPA